MTDTPSPFPAAPLDAAAYAPLPREGWARVHAHDRVMRYLRRGAGRPIVALSDDTTTDAPWPVLAAALTARYRVLLPELPADVVGGDFVAWLDAFLDGIGAAPVAILAFGRRCAETLAFAAADGGRLARVVLVPGESGAAAALAATGRAPVPVMVVPPVAPTDMAFPAVQRFLQGWV